MRKEVECPQRRWRERAKMRRDDRVVSGQVVTSIQGAAKQCRPPPRLGQKSSAVSATRAEKGGRREEEGADEER
eukprot:127110-Pyramimonas_sp.AAC.1